jgi:hypothetical protein
MGENFNQEFDLIELPAGLTSLTAGECYKKAACWTNLPTGLIVNYY